MTVPEGYLFDLDGVLTPTAQLHRRAWRALFDAWLPRLGVREPYQDDDYRAHIDGKPRAAGVRDMLASRGVALPFGAADDPPGAETSWGLANRKNELFQELLERDGVAPYPDALALLRELDVPVAVVSSSRNARQVLAAAGLSFEVVVDGLVIAQRSLAGKPAPDSFLEAARRLGLEPGCCAVVEDAVSGVAAGRAGGFGLVVGVDRDGAADALRDAGADLVVRRLDELWPPAPIADEWTLHDHGLADSAHAGTVFALANGFVGVRGVCGEPGAATFVNGFYETFDIEYPEAAYGFARAGQTIVSAPDTSGVSLVVNGQELRPADARVRRELDLRHGMARGTCEWTTDAGVRVVAAWRRLVSFVRREIVASQLEVTCDAPATVELTLGLREAADADADGFDPRRGDRIDGRGLERCWERSDEAGLGVGYRLAHSGRTVAALAAYDTNADEWCNRVTPSGVERTFRAHVDAGRPLVAGMVAAYGVAGPDRPVDDLAAATRAALDEAASRGLDGLAAEQADWLDAFWADADVRVPVPWLQRAVRWSVFQVAQAAARADGRGIAAKGLTGSGYSGHSFWDTEIFVLPFLTYVRPEWARAALGFRCGMLDQARSLAQVMSEAGALFPWRTIDGREASAFFPAGTAQYHIDADVAHAVWQYLQASDDGDFRAAAGIDLLVETARLWASLGTWSTRSGQRAFHIDEVTGPDEYTALVDDNAYTNIMAARNLRRAADALTQLAGEDPAAHDRAVERFGLRTAEPAQWRAMADGMYVPYDEALGVTPQDDAFLGHQVWDVAGTPADHFPLLLHYHPLVLYRYQVLKQADVVMAMVLAPDAFSVELKRANFDYYEPLTTGDSTLSAAAQAIIAAEVGYSRRALDYVTKAAQVDLADRHGNTRDGVHVASAGGLWSALVFGFAGMRDADGLSFDPRLPSGWSSLSFALAWRGSRLMVRVEPDAIEFALREPGSVTLRVRGEQVHVTGPAPVRVALADNPSKEEQ